MDLSKIHNERLEEMRIAAAEELRKLGEHKLADGEEAFDPEKFMRDATAFARHKANQKPKAKKNKQQKAARRNNRK